MRQVARPRIGMPLFQKKAAGETLRPLLKQTNLGFRRVRNLFRFSHPTFSIP
jgi:hypothetical protein